MSKAKRDWITNYRGDLELRISVEVNGETLHCAMALGRDEQRFGLTPPARYIEESMRRQLMAAVENKLLGPRV